MGGLRELLKHPDEVYALLKLKLSVSLVSSPEAHHNHWSFCYNMLSKITKGCTNLLIQPFDRHLRNAVSDWFHLQLHFLNFVSCMSLYITVVDYNMQVCVFYLVLRALDTVGMLLKPINVTYQICLILVCNWVQRMIQEYLQKSKCLFWHLSLEVCMIKIGIFHVSSKIRINFFYSIWPIIGCITILGLHFVSGGTEDCKILMDEYHNVSTAFLELEKWYVCISKTCMHIHNILFHTFSSHHVVTKT